MFFITQSYFSVPKDVKLNSTHLIMKINNRKELQNIAINHSSDIDYKDFLKIYREYTREPYSFLKMDTTLPARDPLEDLEKTWLLLIKMTVTDQIKSLDWKIMKNEAQYDLNRKSAKYLHCLLIT